MYNGLPSLRTECKIRTSIRNTESEFKTHRENPNRLVTVNTSGVYLCLIPEIYSPFILFNTIDALSIVTWILLFKSVQIDSHRHRSFERLFLLVNGPSSPHLLRLNFHISFLSFKRILAMLVMFIISFCLMNS